MAVHSAHTPLAETLELAGAGVAVTGDLSDVDECRRVVDEAAAALGGLDGLVNNAGVTREVAFEDTDPATFAALFDLNVRGCFYCAQRALAHFAGDAAIVNVSSIHAHGGFPRHAAYAATKGAVNAWTRALAVELAPQGRARQRGRAGRRGGAPHQRPARLRRRRLRSARSRPAASASRATSPRWWRSCCRRRPTSSPGRRSTWTAARPAGSASFRDPL